MVEVQKKKIIKIKCGHLLGLQGVEDRESNASVKTGLEKTCPWQARPNQCLGHTVLLGRISAPSLTGGRLIWLAEDTESLAVT